MNKETVFCRLCSARTVYVGTRLCDRCWELERRIVADPDLAAKILRAVRRGEAQEDRKAAKREKAKRANAASEKGSV